MAKEKQIEAIDLKKRVTVYLTDTNPYLKNGRNAGDAVEVSPMVAKKGIALGHYSEKPLKAKS